MCGRYAVIKRIERIKAEFGAQFEGAPLRPEYNIAPTRIVPVVHYAEQMQERRIDLMTWGLVPFWEKDLKTAKKPFNLRSETVVRSFKHQFKEKRCLLPADGFYEWKKPEGDPYFFSLKDGNMLGFAGVYDSWKSPEGEDLVTCSMILGEPNEVVAPIHGRMPIIIEPENFQRWLSPSLPVEDAQALLKTLPADQMQARIVSRLVNKSSNNMPEILEPLNNG